MGDGSVKLFDINLDRFPIANWASHNREVFSVHWNLISKNTFLSSSWDGVLAIYNPERDQPITAIPNHTCLYSAQFSPHENGVISAVSSDCQLRIFDLRTPASASNHLVLQIPVQPRPRSYMGWPPDPASVPDEVLTHDWNKYRSSVVATAGVDHLIRTFDIRAPAGGPLAVLPGHDFAVKRVSWSPHLPDVLLSSSYDMSIRVWTDGTAVGAQKPQPTEDPRAVGVGGQLGIFPRHTEFTTGIDWCLFGAEGWCATTAWDEKVYVWDVRSIMGG